MAANGTINVNFEISNVGKRNGDEVAQVYVQYPETGAYMPLKQLRGFSRVYIERGKSTKVTVAIPKKRTIYILCGCFFQRY